MTHLYHCLVCEKPISPGVYEFSTEVVGYPVCLKHQAQLEESRATPEAITLFLELRSNALPAELLYWNGNQTVDIALPGQLYIEVNRVYHHETEHALNDLLDAIHSWPGHIPTFQISNAQISNVHQLHMIVDRIVAVCHEARKTA